MVVNRQSAMGGAGRARASKTSSIAETKRKRTRVDCPRSLTTARQTRLKNDVQKPLVFQTGEILSCRQCHEKLFVTEDALTGEQVIIFPAGVLQV